MQTKIMKLADIKPAVYNPRKDLSPGDFEYERLKASIEQFGFVEPLVVNSRNNVLISGHQRLKVLIQNGEAETEVVAVDLDEQKEKALNLAMNKIEGYWDFEKLESLFSEFDPEDLTITGFTSAEIDDMFNRAYGNPSPTVEPAAKEEKRTLRQTKRRTSTTSTTKSPAWYIYHLQQKKRRRTGSRSEA